MFINKFTRQYNIKKKFGDIFMSSQTRIIVIKQQNIIIAAIILAVLIIIAAFAMLRTGSQKEEASPTEYAAGVYSSTVVLNGNPVDIQVVTDVDKIHSITIMNTSESIATMYPMFDSCFEEISSQVIQNNSTDGITYSADNKYTSLVIKNAINAALEKARH